MRWEFHPEALEEYREATLYYAERDPALGRRYVEAVEDAIAEFSNRRNVAGSLMRISDVVLRTSFLTESCTPSNRRSSLLWLSYIVVASRNTGGEES